MSCASATGRIWVFCLQYPWLLSAQIETHTVCTVNVGLALLNSAWVRRQRVHMLLNVWLNPQMSICSEAKRRNVTDGKSMPQMECAEILWMLILENGRQWRCAGYTQVYRYLDTERWFVPLKLIEDQMIKSDFSW